MPDACQVSPLFYSRIILVLAMLSLSLSLFLYVCMCIWPSRGRTRGNSSYFRSAHISLFVPLHLASLPILNAEDISPIQQHSRLLSNLAPCAPPSFLYFPRLRDVWSHLPIYVWRFFLVLPFANPTISLQYGTSDTTGSRCQHSPGFQEMRSSRIFSSPNIIFTFYLARRYIMHFIANKIVLSQVHFTFM